jgi:hypothetical protein
VSQSEGILVGFGADRITRSQEGHSHMPSFMIKSCNVELLMLLIVVLGLGFLLPSTMAYAAVVTYKAPSGANSIPLSSDFSVTADGKEVDVYQVTVTRAGEGYNPCPTRTETASMAYFDFSGNVNVKVTSAQSISNVTVRPLRHNIKPSVSGKTIRFSLSKPINLSIELNGDDRHNLHLFANPMEKNRPNPNDPNVRYFGPGVHGDGSRIILNKDETMYVAGGAIVYGFINNKIIQVGNNSKNGNVSIRGRGIISGAKTTKKCVSGGGFNLLKVMHMQNVELEGFILLDSAQWTTLLSYLDRLTIDNIKGIVYRGNGDGLNIVSSSNVTVKNIFLRGVDDMIALKADPSWYRKYSYGTKLGRSTENVTVKNSAIWLDSTAGHAIAFMEQTAPFIRDVTLKNIDVLHTSRGDSVVWFNSISEEQSNITFDDIRIENMQ